MFAGDFILMTLILLRHSQSVWNVKGLFCGWVDIDVGPNWKNTADFSCKLITNNFPTSTETQNTNDSKSDSIQFDICYTSVLKRSIKTAHYMLEILNQLHIPHKKCWRLNERFYGDLTGKSKLEMVEKYGKKQIKIWRRDFAHPPPKISIENEYHPRFDKKYHKLQEWNLMNMKNDIPCTESLYHVIQRILVLWNDEILPLLKKQKNILCVIHGTSLRALLVIMEVYIEQKTNARNICFEIKNDNKIGCELSHLEIPNGYPIVYQFDSNGNVIVMDEDMIDEQMDILNIPLRIHGRFLGDLQQLVRAQTEVKNQIEKQPQYDTTAQ